MVKIKRKLKTALLIFLVVLLSIPVIALADNRNLTVYIASGSKSAYCYHARSDCPSLSRSRVEAVSLEEAAYGGYTQCSRCNPPKPDFLYTTSARQAPQHTGTRTAGAGNDENVGGLVIAAVFLGGYAIIRLMGPLSDLVERIRKRNRK